MRSSLEALPGLDSGLASTLEQLKLPGNSASAYCFVLANGQVSDETVSFRSNPGKFLTDEPVLYRENPAVQLQVAPSAARCGIDTLTLRMTNFPVPAVDLLYSIDGRVMPPIIHWLLDSEQSATVFVDATTPKGHYHFRAVRDSRLTSNNDWVKVDAFVTVR